MTAALRPQNIRFVGMKPWLSFCCCSKSCGKAANAAMIPQAIKTKETIDQITPQHCEEPPYLFAKTLASDELTFLRIRSSQMSHTLYKLDITPMKSFTNR